MPDEITTSSAGSNAGRGFRYQDLVGALFCVRMLVGEAEFGAVVPEGADDFELRKNAQEILLVDTKATRSNARVRTASQNIGSFRKLWDRPLRPSTVVREYWLVTERSRNGADRHRVPACDLFSSNPPVHASKSFLVNEPDPLRYATALLVERKNLTPLAAEIVVIALTRAIGNLASSNGALSLSERQALGISDIEAITSRVLGAVDAERLERAIRSGFISPVDFTTPISDDGFYLGVDVEPGHFAAGLALDRPEAVARVLQAFDRARTVVVTGPSGAGKSGLMWNTVIASQLDRRWFRVNGTGSPDEEALTAFFSAYSETPIGLVVDDIGHGRLEVWETLRLRAASHPRAIVLGSTRSEDVALLHARHSIVEVSASADANLAASLWQKLRDRGLTTWAGWNEPWTMSGGLLLEFGHILTQRDRLGAIMLDQVRKRLVEQRDVELAVLSASAPVATEGGAVLIDALRAHLDLSAADMARALERLIEEHLIRVDRSGSRLTGLHALRASAICNALAEVGHSTLQEQAIIALGSAAPESLEACVGGLISSGVIEEGAAVGALTSRVAHGHSLSEMASAIRGLRGGALTLITREWIADLRSTGIPPKLATLAAMLGTTPVGALDIGNLRALAEAGRNLFASVAARPPQSSLVVPLITALGATVNGSASDIINALSALATANLTRSQVSDLVATRPSLEDFLMPDVIGILDAAEAINPAIAAAWAAPNDEVNQLLPRLVAETPFALPATREIADTGLVVHADIFEAALEPGENPNDRLFAYATAILRVEPSASVAHVRIVDATGGLTLHLDSEKRIPRENAPPTAHSSANRHVIDVVAQAVGGQSWSAYLSQGESLLTRGHSAFQRVLDNAMVGRVEQEALDELNSIVAACDDLIPPSQTVDTGIKGPQFSGRHLTPLQDLIFNLNGPLILEVAKLPESGARLAARARSMIDQVHNAMEEPWSLIRESVPTILETVQRLLNDIEVVALEAAASRQSPCGRWPKTNGKPKDAFSLAAHGSRSAFIQRIEARRRTLEAILVQELPNAKLAAPRLEDGNLWQSRFVAVFPVATLDALKNWIRQARAIGDRIFTSLTEWEDIALVPLINGKAAIDFAYKLSRGRPASLVAEVLVRAGRSDLLGQPEAYLVRRLTAPVISNPEELEGLFTAIRDAFGMEQLGLGQPGRPPAECERFEIALTELRTAGPKLVTLFDGIHQPAVETLRTLIKAANGHQSLNTGPATFSMDEWRDALAELTWRRASTN